MFWNKCCTIEFSSTLWNLCNSPTRLHYLFSRCHQKLRYSPCESVIRRLSSALGACSRVEWIKLRCRVWATRVTNNGGDRRWFENCAQKKTGDSSWHFKVRVVLSTRSVSIGLQFRLVALNSKNKRLECRIIIIIIKYRNGDYDDELSAVSSPLQWGLRVPEIMCCDMV